MGEMIVIIIIGMCSLCCFVIRVLQFNQKGWLFNNTYIYASKEEKETMDKTHYYRQSAVVFALLTGMFFIIVMGVVFKKEWLFVVEGIFLVVTVIYAVLSSITIAKQKKI